MADDFPQFRHLLQSHQPLVLKLFRHFELPRHVKRYVGRPRPHGQCRGDVAAEGVAHHEQPVGCDAESAAQGVIGLFRLVGDDLDVVKQRREPRTLQFVLLVEQLTLGEHHFADAAECPERLPYAGQRCGRQGEQLLAHVDDAPDLVARDTSVTHTDGVFDERQRERLGPVAEQCHVAGLRLKQFAGNDVSVAVGGKQFAVAPFDVGKVGLTVPERVVRVECYHVDAVTKGCCLHDGAKVRKKVEGLYHCLPLDSRSIVKIWNNPDKHLANFEEFENKSLAAANSSKFRVHLLLSEHQCVTTKTTKVCNIFTVFSAP